MRRDINFFSVYRMPQSEGESRTFNKVAVILLVASLAVVLAVFGGIKILNLRAVSADNANQSYLKSSEILEFKKQIQNAKTKLSAISSYKQAAQRVSEGFDSLPQPDSELLAFIASKLPEDTSADAMSYSEGTLTIQCSSNDSLSAAKFAHALEESGRFSSVNYSKIFKSNENSRFTFSVMISLKGDSEK
ncbi:hypothetical protein CCDG5_1934 [[Clostridium] cellulosi]|jgi:Fimbrial assembly protein (PilN).|uniref:Fimbrial assembly family protein n=1 Tax=[Clostridium] cellulosi TaxID=29343 RepID=A0A078KMP6_9FIRM|nr:MAG: hypothetical protein DIU81_05175 [[Clostridium] cellulosi]CDZ25026.1 hypothetical protein CCDG5_1934 [[Clostridium] cellulosi]